MSLCQNQDIPNSSTLSHIYTCSATPTLSPNWALCGNDIACFSLWVVTAFIHSSPALRSWYELTVNLSLSRGVSGGASWSSFVVINLRFASIVASSSSIYQLFRVQRIEPHRFGWCSHRNRVPYVSGHTCACRHRCENAGCHASAREWRERIVAMKQVAECCSQMYREAIDANVAVNRSRVVTPNNPFSNVRMQNSTSEVSTRNSIIQLCWLSTLSTSMPTADISVICGTCEWIDACVFC